MSAPKWDRLILAQNGALGKNPKVIFDKYETNRAEVCLFVFFFI